MSVDDVKEVVVETLGIQDRAAAIEATTPLLGAVPELDSMAVLEVLLALEDRFDVTLDGQDLTAEAFESLASLTALVDSAAERARRG